MSDKPAAGKAPLTVRADDPKHWRGTLKGIGGSQSNNWNTILASQTLNTRFGLLLRTTNPGIVNALRAWQRSLGLGRKTKSANAQPSL